MFSDGAKRAPRKGDAKMTNEAKRFLADINANVRAWSEGRIDYETFSARQCATWDAIHAAPPAIAGEVLRAMRHRLPPARPSREGRA
jgi:hypothetical protein